ncbi:hypothetical protein CC80DRAFT_444276 [Byssothecium circinans]|uniref:MARVEL domain-containing protein n=1 Tax=Byssothecium circinans TaxID=147558 RepID=A0A6A5U758_9PLEO|nr:hypothetical protein CC80DRAFT_444276 [Byssothecium circinans]
MTYTTMAAPTPNWKKRILLPIWIIRICAMVFLIAAFSWAVWAVQNSNDLADLELNMAVVVVYLIILVLVLLGDVAQMILFFIHRLTPLPFLVINALQTAFWTGDAIMQFVYIGRSGNGAGIGLNIFLFILYVSLLIYAIIGFNRSRKQRKLGQYVPAHNPTGDELPDYNGPAVSSQHTAYQSPMHTGGDLGEHSIPHPNHGAANDYYPDAPTKPAAMA